MTTPRQAPWASREMGSTRANARFIVKEGYGIFDLAQEALVLLEERQTGHDVDEQFPPMPEYAEVPDPVVPAGAEEDTEEEILESGGIRDPDKLPEDFDLVWINWYGFPEGHDKMPDELRKWWATGVVIRTIFSMQSFALWYSLGANWPVILGLAMVGSIRTIFWLTGWDEIVE
ncbi:hypothetical protein PHISCL_08797 [Aspergillus sclerotialis]|uniref:Uncharacterized protein n=1 Tax=Aspergillus sclerotialis TaxID=2070753 RepID=A0A3A2Z6Y0_9EURO|nr:hypothetical protein PHISCL_08797 [Aspergillus sclerotialis]